MLVFNESSMQEAMKGANAYYAARQKLESTRISHTPLFGLSFQGVGNRRRASRQVFKSEGEPDFAVVFDHGDLIVVAGSFIGSIFFS